MSQITGFLTVPLTATVAVPNRTIIKFGAAENTGVPATDATACLIGISSEIDTAIGERLDCYSVGNAPECKYGGTVTRGDPITADAQGRAIKATTAGQNCVGFAMISGVVGDIGRVAVTPFIF